jgi:heme O synthase-like polyprenyltransferase
MSADVRAYIELMRPKNMVLAAITVPLGALFGLSGTLEPEQFPVIAASNFSCFNLHGCWKCYERYQRFSN